MIEIEPTTSALEVGEATRFEVRLADVPRPGLAAFQFEIAFDPTVVNLSDPNAGAAAANPFAPLGEDPTFCAFVRGTPCDDPPWFLESTGREALLRMATIDNLNGRMTLVYGSLGAPLPSPLPTGDGVIALIDVLAVGGGKTSLTLENVILSDASEPPSEYDLETADATVDVDVVDCADDRDCAEDQFCRSEPGECRIEPESSRTERRSGRHEHEACRSKGTCALRPASCSDLIDPVCGCDGTTYDNHCHAAQVGVSIDFLGTCPPTPTPSPTPTSSVRPTATPTGTASPTPTASASATPTASVSPTGTGSPTPTPTASPAPTASASPTATPTGAGSPTPTATASATPTSSVSPTATPTGAGSPTPTASASATPTPSPSATGTGSPTPTATASPTPTSSVSPTPPPIVEVLIRTGHLGMKEPPNPRNRVFKFRSNTEESPPENRIVLPESGSAGDPTRAGAELRVYNSAGLTSDDVTILLPASGWKRIGGARDPDGYRFKSRGDDPIERVLVTKNRLLIRGEGEGFAYTVNEPSQGRIAVRLELGSGVAFCADAAGTKRDRVNRFVARKEPPPPSCP